ncbi:hypothetical protein R50073_22710 [Maricurvus nonylphenolicus]
MLQGKFLALIISVDEIILSGVASKAWAEHKNPVIIAPLYNSCPISEKT